MDNNEIYEPVESEIIETPDKEVMSIVNEGDPDTMLAILERKAELAPRYAKAIQAILMTQTYPQDWQEFNGTMALSSAGAERVARSFDIQTTDVKSRKEEFTDSEGKGYRYIFEGNARMGNKSIYAQGAYSTRDNFLGKKGEEWRPIEEINENTIRNAAYHIFIGNAVKALLGLRHIPREEFDNIMNKAGADCSKASKTTFASGSKGGTSQDDVKLQSELGNILMDMANNMQLIVVDDEGNHTVIAADENDTALDIASKSCQAASSFWSKKDEKLISGKKSLKLLKGKWLMSSLKKTKEIYKEYKDVIPY